jgi:hypothetical protein
MAAKEGPAGPEAWPNFIQLHVEKAGFFAINLDLQQGSMPSIGPAPASKKSIR